MNHMGWNHLKGLNDADEDVEKSRARRFGGLGKVNTME
jgi:hypothetical protein